MKKFFITLLALFIYAIGAGSTIYFFSHPEELSGITAYFGMVLLIAIPAISWWFKYLFNLFNL